MENRDSKEEVLFFCFSTMFSTTLSTKGEHSLKDLIFEVHFACSVLALYLD